MEVEPAPKSTIEKKPCTAWLSALLDALSIVSNCHPFDKTSAGGVDGIPFEFERC